MPIVFGDRQVKWPSPQLGALRDRNDILDNAEQLQLRLEEDGYLIIRGLHDRKKGAGGSASHSSTHPSNRLQGTLAICVGSHRLPDFEIVRQTYGQADVDCDHIHGHFSNNPFKIVEKIGGIWKTTHFKAGDVIVFGMFTMHASTQTTKNRWRLSCDTRFQPADEPVDERWIGVEPKGHYVWQNKEPVPIEQSRSEWGV